MPCRSMHPTGAALVKKIIPDEYDKKMAYAKKCVQSWMTRRATLLTSYRMETEAGRLSTEEREEILEDFWKGIDQEIKRGELPKP